MLGYTEQRLLATDTALDPPAYPIRTKPDGSWLVVGANDWTAGFYAAALWRTYERTRDPAWRQRAQTWQAGLASETTHDSTDLGFKIFDTFGVGYQLTGDASYKKVVLDAADTVARRYDPDVGMFRVWDADDRTQYRVNIDAMMNMELMFWAGQNGGDPRYAEMAEHHAQRALRDLVRPDGSTYMFAGYDQNTGALLNHFTKQGYATDSTWSRGQAWAVYGFTTAYRYTKDPRFLDAARRTADWFVQHLPPDHVPYWDFECRTRRCPARHVGCGHRRQRPARTQRRRARHRREAARHRHRPRHPHLAVVADLRTARARVRGDAAARHPASAEGVGRHRHHVRRLLLRRGARALREAGRFNRGVHVELTTPTSETHAWRQTPADEARATPRRPGRRPVTFTSSAHVLGNTACATCTI